jgi:hypothetical protein
MQRRSVEGQRGIGRPDNVRKLILLSSVLPTGRIFGRISQKEPNKKWSGRTNPATELWPILNKKSRKGPNLKKLYPSTYPL